VRGGALADDAEDLGDVLVGVVDDEIAFVRVAGSHHHAALCLRTILAW
jgi:hypothetical protein